MANEQNLIQNHERTPSELREMTKKGGIASGKSRRKKAEFKKALNIVLSSKVQNKQLEKILEEMGFENTNESAIALLTVQKALKGDMRAIELIERSTAPVLKDNLDKKEQRERIKAMELENKRRELMLGTTDNEEAYNDGFIEALKGTVEETWQGE